MSSFVQRALVVLFAIVPVVLALITAPGLRAATRPQDGAPAMTGEMDEKGDEANDEARPAGRADSEEGEESGAAVTAPPLPIPADAVRSAADIDVALEATWAKAGVKPSAAAAPEVWLRRVWLDLAGEIPPADAVRAFARDGSPAARARVVERLLAGREWAAHWGRVLGRSLLAPRAEPDRQLGAALEKAVGERLAAGATWPAVARALVVGGGPGDASTAFRSQFAEAPYEIAGQLGSAVFGMRLRCAQCHDDPLQGWKVADYYGLAAFFGSPRRLSVPAKLYENWKAGKIRNFYELVMNVPEMRPRGVDHRWVRREIEGYAAELRQLSKMGFGNQPVPEVSGLDWAAYDVYRIHAARRAANKDGGFGRRTSILSDRDGGDLIMPPLPASPLAADHAPPTGKPVPPRWPNDPTRAAPAQGTRRAALAAFVGDPSNELVARAFTNRVWYELMGHGLVEPVDEVVRPTTAPHAALLNRLAAGFSAHRGSIKWLLATITATRAYALACAPTSTSDVPLPSRPLTRPHYGLEIEMGAPLIPDAPIIRETARRDALSAEPLPDVRPAGQPPVARASPAPASPAPASPPSPGSAAITSARGALVPVPPLVAAPSIAPPTAPPPSAPPPSAPPPAAAPAAPAADPEVLFAVRMARPLDAVEVEAALRRATGREAASPELTKALAKSFDPEGSESESGMRRGGLGRGLFLLTGPELQKVVDEAPLLGELGKKGDAGLALEELFVRTLGRAPDEGERSRLAAALGKVPDGAAGRRPWADMLWALVSSAEFLTNH